MNRLTRQLGLAGSTAIGVAAMLGAGVFYVWKPAWDIAGPWLFVSLAIAAFIATLNGLVTAQLAIRLPVAGGIYAFGRHYRGPFTGFMAGWMFLTGKTGSAAAIAYIAASYLLPDYSRLLAIGAVVVFSSVIIVGIRPAAGISVVVSGIVIGGLLWFALPEASLPDTRGWSADVSASSILQAAALMFFAFAGYARMATLGEEVKKPSKTIPRAIVAALVIVLGVYLVVALALANQMVPGTTMPDAPLTLLVDAGQAGILTVLAALASLGSLLAILAGLSRTSFAMARNRELPGALAYVSPRTGGPIVAEISVALAAIVLIWFTNPLWLVGLSSAGVLTYYAIGHFSALAQSASERFLPTAVPVVGLVVNVSLVLTLPIPSLLAAAGFAATGAVWFALTKRQATSD